MLVLFDFLALVADRRGASERALHCELGFRISLWAKPNLLDYVIVANVVEFFFKALMELTNFCLAYK